MKCNHLHKDAPTNAVCEDCYFKLNKLQGGNTKMETYRQGDVLLVRVGKLPKRLKAKDKVLALGEVTGHKHQFKSNQVQVFADKQGKQFVDVQKKAELTHEEHDALDVPAGTYEVVIQKEFDIVEQTERQVMD